MRMGATGSEMPGVRDYPLTPQAVVVPESVNARLPGSAARLPVIGACSTPN
jgi:hypothetical protein